jgi:hypothetical protein
MKKNPTTVLNAIRKTLGMEVKLEQVVAENGITLEAESFEPGYPVFVVAEEERLPLPVGEYELQGGSVLVVAEEGVIAELRTGEPMPEEEEVMMEEEPAAKKVVESVTKETHFSAEDFTALLSRVEALEAKLAEKEEPKKEELSKQEKPEAVEVELAEEKPSKHDPELEVKPKTKIHFNKPQTLRDRVLSKLN